ncbi:hypothetical protein BLA29_001898 [Euroglyphus maynei]|uniref:Transmembrane protein family 132 middle domain-containing protein n=1 Tax=Euroglyphus maynei TaxID=6958 RepID=A0A1Y3AMP1_EURMA|nr:hypothetical protein BLA29_001898 [Euroglyphus maynei]
MTRKTINPFSVCRNDSSSFKTGKSSNGDRKNISEQINAYLVTREVRRSHPVLRVLFYASHINHNNVLSTSTNRNEQSICAVVIVQYHGERLFGTCSPSQNRLNACLAEIVIPALYWPPLDVTNGVPFRGSYEEVTNDNVVTVLIPQEPVYPNSKIYIPVKYTYNPEYPISAFTLRVQVKPGLRILGAQLSHTNKLWQLSIELGTGQTSATVTAFLRDSSLDSQSLLDELMANISQEVYSWLIEVTDQVNIGEMNARIVWQLLYEMEANNAIHSSIEQHSTQPEEKESIKLTSLIDIQKDVMQEIVAITSSKELLNTAVLNGRQISRTMRIYQVSAAGHISDITFQCSCQSIDESIIKVSTSCTSVYLDGSEIRGRWFVHRHIRFGSMNFNHGSSSSLQANHFDDVMLADQPNDDDDDQFGYWPESFNSIRQICQLKFQQARIEVYTRYTSSDHDSGREASLVNRRHLIRITKIVQNMIRVSDKKIIRILRGNIIEGVSAGTANVELISPITGAIIGSKRIQVNTELENITNMKVHLISGIRMDIEPVGRANPNIWIVRTSLMDSLTKQYQEALLEARLYFSDQTSTYLSDVSPDDYHLTINTFKGVVDNVTRNNAMENRAEIGSFIYDMPRIIALMPGQGERIHMTIDSIRSCQKKKSKPLSSSFVNVDVNIELPNSMFSLQNDAIHYRRYGTIHHNQTVIFR